jgi:heat-inducible transcriptional repressor
MVKTIDHEKRKNEILAATVDFYIQNATAVSSQMLSDSFSYSSATIRNVLSELEEDGLLTHTHTSSGRIPTDKGYRFYVDNLLLEIELLEEEKKKVIQEYKNTRKELDILLEKTVDLLSSLSRCTGIVSFYDWQDRMLYKGMSLILEQPEFRDLNKIKSLMNLLEQKERLLEVINQKIDEKIKIYIGRELPFEDIEDYTLILSNYHINNKPQGRIAVLGPTRLDYAKIIPAVEFISNMLSDILSEF